MNFSEHFNQAVVDFLQRQGRDAVAILDFDDYAMYFEGCPTCGGDYEYTVDITYRDSKNKRMYYGYNGTFSSLLRELC